MNNKAEGWSKELYLYKVCQGTEVKQIIIANQLATACATMRDVYRTGECSIICEGVVCTGMAIDV